MTSGFWSLWQLMKSFDVWMLTSVLHRIDAARTDGIKFELDNGNRDKAVEKKFLQDSIDPLLRDAREFSAKAELAATNARVNEHGGFSISLDYGLSYQELDFELRVLRESLQSDLSSKVTYIVEETREPYINRNFLLEMWGKSGFYFPSITKDAPAAMRAYVCDLNTACVFHLMRITEIGLRALARRMRVHLPRNRQLEWGQWNDIIMAMTKKTDLIANRKASNSRDELLEFYRGAIGEFQGYKDAYRNYVMHMREKSYYDPNEARSLLERVSHFMDRLSDKIDEQGRVLTEARRKKMFAKVDADIEEEKRKADEQAKQGIRELQRDNAAPDTSSTRQIESGTGSREAAESTKTEG